jgi:hypothetical protein
MNLRTIWLIFVLCCMTTKTVSATYRYEISVAAIFQDEAPYLKEWIEYYKLLGVDHFYLYNHLSTDDYANVLAPYIAKGDVDLIEWNYYPNTLAEWRTIQPGAYKDAVKISKNHTKWLAIIDIDEFIVPVKKKNLKKLLSRYESDKSIGGVCIPWVFFGTSNVYKIPENKLMIETLLLNGGVIAGENKSKIWNSGSYKSIVRPKYVSNAVSAHYCVYVPHKKHVMLDLDKAQINHYWTRDEYFLTTIKLPRRLFRQQSEKSVLEWAAEMNKKTPQGKPILRFIPELRKRMGL